MEKAVKENISGVEKLIIDMEKLVTKSGNIGYRYDEGERPDFDAYISRLAE